VKRGAIEGHSEYYFLNHFIAVSMMGIFYLMLKEKRISKHDWYRQFYRFGFIDLLHFINFVWLYKYL